MKNVLKDQSGATLVELLVYLAISSIVVLATTGFLGQATHNRVTMADQQSAQQANRVLLEQMTYALRNAYDVEVSMGGDEVDIYAHNYGAPGTPIIATFRQDGDQLLYAQSLTGTPPDDSTLAPLTDQNIEVQTIDFTKVSSSLVVHMTVAKNQKTASTTSTISFRQEGS